jgi:hypothetical protein
MRLLKVPGVGFRDAFSLMLDLVALSQHASFLHGLSKPPPTTFIAFKYTLHK